VQVDNFKRQKLQEEQGLKVQMQSGGLSHSNQTMLGQTTLNSTFHNQSAAALNQSHAPAV